MKTKVIRMNPQELDMEGIREAGEILKQGGKTGTGSCQILSSRNIRGTGSNQSTGGSVCGNEIYADRWY